MYGKYLLLVVLYIKRNLLHHLELLAHGQKLFFARPFCQLLPCALQCLPFLLKALHVLAIGRFQTLFLRTRGVVLCDKFLTQRVDHDVQGAELFLGSARVLLCRLSGVLLLEVLQALEKVLLFTFAFGKSKSKSLRAYGR